jgi:hypothetical protein
MFTSSLHSEHMRYIYNVYPSLHCAYLCVTFILLTYVSLHCVLCSSLRCAYALYNVYSSQHCAFASHTYLHTFHYTVYYTHHCVVHMHYTTYTRHCTLCCRVTGCMPYASLRALYAFASLCFMLSRLCTIYVYHVRHRTVYDYTFVLLVAAI